MEEAGEASRNAIESRLSIWRDRGSRKFEDSPTFKTLLGDPKNYFGQDNKLQRTLNMLIRCENSAYGGQPLSVCDVKRHQRTSWGTSVGRSAALEVSALPQNNTKVWSYNHLLRDQRFQTRKSYHEFLLSVRVPMLSDAIKTHRPRAVVFYSTSKKYLKILEEIKKQLSSPQTIFHEVPHPASFLATKRRFEELGMRIRESGTLET